MTNGTPCGRAACGRRPGPRRPRPADPLRLTDHFDSTEFDCRDGTRTPPEYVRSARKLCLKYLEPLRAEFGPTVILSGFRSPKHNARVGGAPSSMHLQIPFRFVAAADVRCAAGTPAEWHHFLEHLNPGGLGRYSTFVHVDNRPVRARW